MDTTIGTCGRCGGAVTIPSYWMSVIPPTPKCVACGATPKEAHGPVLPMNNPGTHSDPQLYTKTSRTSNL